MCKYKDKFNCVYNISALINLLITYCEANVEEPRSESIFDILVGLNELKKYSNELRKILFDND